MAIHVALLFCTWSAIAEETWTLESSIKRVMGIAPESQEAEAKVRAQQGALEQAGVWSNPEIGIRGDNEIEKDEGSSGASVTQLSFSQPLPVTGRLKHQKSVAKAKLHRAQSEQQLENILLERETAQRFHVLQLAMARLDLAQQRLQLADELQSAGRRREEAGELAKLERLRLDIIREEAKQGIDEAEGEAGFKH